MAAKNWKDISFDDSQAMVERFDKYFFSVFKGLDAQSNLFTKLYFLKVGFLMQLLK